MDGRIFYLRWEVLRDLWGMQKMDQIDEIESMIDRFMEKAQDVLIWASAGGIVLLIAVQAYLAWRG